MPAVATLTNVWPVGRVVYYPQAKARQRASERILEVVELKSSSWYNTDNEVMKMSQTKAHIEATGRYEKKAYDKILLRIRKDAGLNGDVIRTHAEAMGESVNSFLLRAVAEAIERDNAKMADKEE